MDKARIAELLQPFLTWPLSARQLGDISTYIDILLKWNQRMNLTAVRKPEEIVTRHFGESLFAAQHLFPPVAHVGAGALTCPAERSSAPQTRASFDFAQDKSGAMSDEIKNLSPGVVDVGSGAGFPGLPIKIWAPEIRLTLIESNHKKATFLKEVIRALELDEVDVFNGRAETFPAASTDVVTLRAVERFGDILRTAASLVKPTGRLALFVGNSQIEAAMTLVEYLDWQAPLSLPYSHNRALLVARK